MGDGIEYRPVADWPLLTRRHPAVESRRKSPAGGPMRRTPLRFDELRTGAAGSEPPA